MKRSLQAKKKLNNDIKMPILGLGTYENCSGRKTIESILYGLELGYRHLDTASLYGNEVEVGQAVRESNLSRADIFVTTKLWNSDHGYQSTIDAFYRSLDKLKFDYIDLYLLHWPVENLRLESWRALEQLYAEGLCKAIGVSNFLERHLQEILDNFSIIPIVNQVEFHPYLYQKELLKFCNANKIVLEAYSPLAKGFRLNEPILNKISNKYDKSPAQLLIRWCLEKGVVVIPKSSNKNRISENSQVFDFNIEPSDMKILDNLNENYHCSWDPTGVP